MLLCALAHNFVHKNCEETGWAVGKLRRPGSATNFIAKISFSKINNLPLGKGIPHKFIHRNCGQVSSGRRAMVATRKFDKAPARILRMEKYPLRIKELSCRRGSCAHFYPQKVCRTLLAAKLATRYIAQFVSALFFYLFRSSFCSPFFKPPAGPSGCC